jgi:hypothetical protein
MGQDLPTEDPEPDLGLSRPREKALPGLFDLTPAALAVVPRHGRFSLCCGRSGLET